MSILGHGITSEHHGTCYLTGVRFSGLGTVVGVTSPLRSSSVVYFFSAFSFFAICSISLGLSSARTLSTMLDRDSPSREQSAEDPVRSTDPFCPSDKDGALGSENG